jgi:hypothetical protein
LPHWPTNDTGILRDGIGPGAQNLPAVCFGKAMSSKIRKFLLAQVRCWRAESARWVLPLFWHALDQVHELRIVFR